MKLYALVSYKNDVIADSTDLKELFAYKDMLATPCSIHYAEKYKSGYNTFINVLDNIRRADNIPCLSCDYCKQHHLRCMHMD